jgi:hypothetical protein
MEISPMDLERALGSVNELALPALGAVCLYHALCHGVSGRVSARAALPAGVRKPRSTSTPVRRALSLLGLAVGLSSPATAGAGERSLLRRRPAHTLESSALRSEPGRFPPPRLPGPAEPPVEGAGMPPPWLREPGEAATSGAPAREGTRKVERADVNESREPTARSTVADPGRPLGCSPVPETSPAPRPAADTLTGATARAGGPGMRSSPARRCGRSPPTASARTTSVASPATGRRSTEPTGRRSARTRT